MQDERDRRIEKLEAQVALLIAENAAPHPLRFPLAFDGRLLGAVLRIFIDTVAAWYRARQERRGLGGGATGAVAVIQRGSSDLPLNPHFHVLFLDGGYRLPAGRLAESPRHVQACEVGRGDWA